MAPLVGGIESSCKGCMCCPGSLLLVSLSRTFASARPDTCMSPGKSGARASREGATHYNLVTRRHHAGTEIQV